MNYLLSASSKTSPLCTFSCVICLCSSFQMHIGNVRGADFGKKPDHQKDVLIGCYDNVCGVVYGTKSVHSNTIQCFDFHWPFMVQKICFRVYKLVSISALRHTSCSLYQHVGCTFLARHVSHSLQFHFERSLPPFVRFDFSSVRMSRSWKVKHCIEMSYSEVHDNSE